AARCRDGLSAPPAQCAIHCRRWTAELKRPNKKCTATCWAQCIQTARLILFSRKSSAVTFPKQFPDAILPNSPTTASTKTLPSNPGPQHHQQRTRNISVGKIIIARSHEHQCCTAQ